MLRSIGAVAPNEMDATIDRRDAEKRREWKRMTRKRGRGYARIGFAAVLTVSIGIALANAFLAAAHAKDKVRVVDSLGMAFPDWGLYIAEAEGHYAAENLEVSIIVARGGADALQSVTGGTQDMVYGTGILGVIAAHAKGAPVTIVASAVYGADDSFWLVPSASPIKTLKDLDGKSMTYSSPGSVSHLLGETLVKELGIRAKLVSGGSLAAQRTMMMSGQVDSANSALPAGLDMVRSGEARIIGGGKDSPTIKKMTTRVVAANTDWLTKNRDVATRFLRATWKGQQVVFGTPAQRETTIARYAEHWKFDAATAKLVYDFYTLDDLRYAPLGDLDGVLKLAQDYSFLKEPLTADQKKSLVTMLYDPGR
jgi:NitT/TauT family transport system substrate-binding protein